MRSFSDPMKPLKDWWRDDRHAIPRFIRDITLNRVGLNVLTYDAVADVYHLDYMHVRRADLPPAAVHVTGGGNAEYYLDMVQAGDYPKPGYMNATDLYLYMINNDISEALTNVRKPPFIMDTKTAGLILLGIVAAAAVIVFKLFM